MPQPSLTVPQHTQHFSQSVPVDVTREQFMNQLHKGTVPNNTKKHPGFVEHYHYEQAMNVNNHQSDIPERCVSVFS